MRFILSIYFLFSSLILLAQQERGANVISNNYKNKTTTRVLIIGVSQYSNLSIEKQLEYADDDAYALYDFFKQRSDVVESHNIMALFNNDATDKYKIFNILSTYYDESEAGDRVIIYFAGHGDIQNINGDDSGFLLLHNVANNADYFSSDAININELHRFIKGFSQKEVSVFLITDACRSGKLLSTNENTRRVLASLSQEYDYVFKMVSCQVNQVSYEGSQWGGGHGVFSYYLINGLKGLADKNNNKQIRFGELSRYVINNVLDATSDKQEPEKSGNSDFEFISVDSKVLAQAKFDFKNQNKSSGQSFTPELLSQPVFYDLTSVTQRYIDRFTTSIDKGELVSEKSNDKNRVLGSEVVYMDIKDETFSNPHKNNTYTVSISTDNKVFISGGADKRVLLHDAISAKVFKGYVHNGVLSSCFDPRGNVFVTGGWNQKINVWNINDDKPIKSFSAHNNDIRVIEYSKSGKLLASSGNDGVLEIWETENWNRILSIKVSKNVTVNDIAFIGNDKKIITVGDDGYVNIWDISTGLSITKRTIKTKINSISVKDDETEFITGDHKGNIIIWDLKRLYPISVFSSGMQDVKSISVTPNFKYAFVGGIERRLMFFDIEKEKKIKELKIPHGITNMALSSDFKTLIIAMYDGYIGKIDLDVKLLEKVSKTDYIYDNLIGMNEVSHLKSRLNSYYTLALQKYSQNVIDVFLKGGDVFPSSDDIKQAKLYLNKAIEINANNKLLLQQLTIDKKILQAYDILQRNSFSSYKKAVKNIQDVIDEIPDASYTHNSLVVFYQKLHELEKAKVSVNIAIRQIPDWIAPKINLGITLFLEGSYHKAIAEFDKIILEDPDNAKAHKNRADVLTFMGYYNDASISYEKAIKTDSQYLGAYLRYGELNAIIGDYKRAFANYNKVINIDDSYIRAYVYIARLNRVLFLKDDPKNTKKAIAWLEEGLKMLRTAITINPNSPQINLELGYYFHTLSVYGKYAGGILEKEFPRFSSTGQINRASVRASTYFRKSLSLNPFLLEAYRGLMYGYLWKKDKKQAKDIFDKMVRKLPNEPKTHCFMADYHLCNSNVKKALKCYKKAIDLNEYYTPAFYLYTKLQKSEKDYSLTKDFIDYSFIKTDLYKNNNAVSYKYLQYVY